MELTSNQFSRLMQRLPNFELSYETISHNKVSPIYDICLAIPLGRKYFAWFTFYDDNDVCFLLELNREKKIVRAKIVPATFAGSLALGTIVYGTLWQETGREFFIIEDILYFQGISMKTTVFGERVGFLQQTMSLLSPLGPLTPASHIAFALTVFWKADTTVFGTVPPNIAFPVHHLQYRSGHEIAPYLNVTIQRKTTTLDKGPARPGPDQVAVRIDLSKPQYKYKTVFQVTADPQYDIYNLYAYGKSNQPVFYNIAYIPSYKISVFMNSLFRKIRENRNLDYIEESDDEDDFQNTHEHKYVDTQKRLLMECAFHTKFKKWVPLRVVDSRTKIVHISKL